MRRKAAYLCIGQPSLSLVREVEPAADPAMLLQTLRHTKESGDEEAGVIKRYQNLGAPMTDDGVDEII